MLKKIYRKAYRAWLGRRLSEEEFRYILSELLGLKSGDSVLVHASFGNLKAGFSPKKAVEILMEIIGPEGNILMPYYPYDSKKFLESGEVFDVHSTPTRSGILSAVFSTFPGVKKSIHPIKSLAVWGKDRDYLISEHHLSKTPYDDKSPYGKMIHLSQPKAIGLAIFKNAGVHSYEDMINSYPKYYSQEIFAGKCKNYSGNEVVVNTPIHHATSPMVPLCKYLKLTNCPGYSEFSFSKRRFYVSDYIAAYNHVKNIVELEGFTAEKIFEKQSLLSKINLKLVRL